MSCSFCSKTKAIIVQYGANIFLSVDRVLNVILAGDANETLSQRSARASEFGVKSATVFCNFLAWFSPNHCLNSLKPGTMAAEIVHWSPPRLPNNPPVQIDTAADTSVKPYEIFLYNTNSIDLNKTQ